jgi:hypothetical protein
MAKFKIKDGVVRTREHAVASLNLGDRVKIKHYGGRFGRIVELRGALGPNGAPVYRVMVQRRPTASYIELLGSQLEPAPALKTKVTAPSAPAIKTIPASKASVTTKAGHVIKRNRIVTKNRKPK